MSRPLRPADLPMLDPDMLIKVYAMGIFPMADDRDADEVYWVEPKTRGIMPLDGFHLSKSLKKTLVSGRFRVTADKAFGAVIEKCAESVDDRPSTWINRSIEQAFRTLYARGLAHSVEVWDDSGDRPKLVGGLYGLALGRVFFGESMFSRATDASKIALAWLVARLRVGGYALLDCQFITDHLASLGAIEITRSDYMKRLNKALYSPLSPSDSASLSAFGVPPELLSDLAAGLGAEGFAPAAFGALDAVLSDPSTPAVPSSPSTSEGFTAGPPPGVVIAQLLTMTS